MIKGIKASCKNQAHFSPSSRLSFCKLFRFAALLLLLAIFSALIFEAFHAAHEEHCHEEDCPICLVLQILHNTNKISDTAPTMSDGFIYFCYINIIICSALLLVPATLVSQKIKLSI